MRLRALLDRVLQPFRAPRTVVTSVAPPPPVVPSPPMPQRWREPPVPKADVPLSTSGTATGAFVPPWRTRVSEPAAPQHATTKPDAPAAARAPHAGLADAVRGPSDDEIARADLRPVQGDGALAGITEKMIVEDAHTRQRYVFKLPDAKHQAFERELVALRLRRACGQPSVAVAEQRVRTADGTVLDGYVKPFVPSQGALPNDPKQWTEKQKASVLVDHLWAELTGNYDTKPVQYVVVGDDALNIDWDHAGRDWERNPWASWGVLDRHKSGALAPAAQRLLLSSWVRGEVSLDSTPLWDALERIEKLTRADMANAVEPLLRATIDKGEALGPFTTREQVVDHMVERQKSLRWRFADMLRRASNEREDWRLLHAGRRTTTQQRILFSFGEARLTVLTLAMSTPIFDVGYQISQKWQAMKRALGF